MPPDSTRGLHWDLMLEASGLLLTWALMSDPTSQSTVEAEALPPHRLHYLEYEGPVSGNRGKVSRWDSGSFEWLQRSESELSVRVQGVRLKGRLSLRKLDDAQRWRVSFEADGSAAVCAGEPSSGE